MSRRPGGSYRRLRPVVGGLVLLGGLAACSSSGSGPGPTPSSAPAPVSCAATPCTAAGAVRWSVPLGVSMRLIAATPVAYLAAGGDRPVLASAGGTLVVGYDRTLTGLRLSDGATVWHSADLVPSGQAISAVHPVDGDLVVSSRSTAAGTTAGVDRLLDPASGRVLAQVPARVNEGIVWTDGRSVVAVEPAAVVRRTIATGAVQWSIALPASTYRRAPAGASYAVTAAVAGSRLVFGDPGAGYRVVTLATGAAVAGVAPVRGSPIGVSGSIVILDGDAGLYDLATGTQVWAGAPGDDFRSFDAVDRVLYVVHSGGSGVRAVAAAAPTPRPLPSAITETDLVSVHDGVAVAQIGASDGAVPGTVFVGRSVRSGAVVWTSPALANYYPTPVPPWADAGGQSYATDYVGGLTCPAQDASATACLDVAVTLVND
jgi:hypothetical protein